MSGPNKHLSPQDLYNQDIKGFKHKQKLMKPRMDKTYFQTWHIWESISHSTSSYAILNYQCMVRYGTWTQCRTKREDTPCWLQGIQTIFHGGVAAYILWGRSKLTAISIPCLEILKWRWPTSWGCSEALGGSLINWSGCIARLWNTKSHRTWK